MYVFTDAVQSIVGSRPIGRGKNVMVRCPIHGDRDPSLSVNVENGLWLCFACGAKGNLWKLAEIFGKVLSGDIAALATTHSIEVEETKDFAAVAKQLSANLFIHRPEAVVEYVTSRRLLPGVVRHFSLGYDPDRRAIALPYWDGDACTGIKYRSADGRKTSESGSHYGIYNVDNVRTKPLVILTEGESDAHSAWSHLTAMGVSGTLIPKVGVGGISGANQTAQKWELLAVDLLWAKRIVVIFDSDEAGAKGAATAVEALGERAVSLTPTKGKDLTDHLLAGGTLSEIGVLDELSKDGLATGT